MQRLKAVPVKTKWRRATLKTTQSSQTTMGMGDKICIKEKIRHGVLNFDTRRRHNFKDIGLR